MNDESSHHSFSGSPAEIMIAINQLLIDGSDKFRSASSVAEINAAAATFLAPNGAKFVSPESSETRRCIARYQEVVRLLASERDHAVARVVSRGKKLESARALIDADDFAEANRIGDDALHLAAIQSLKKLDEQIMANEPATSVTPPPRAVYYTGSPMMAVRALEGAGTTLCCPVHRLEAMLQAIENSPQPDGGYDPLACIDHFCGLVRKCRDVAGFGLREFSELIGMLPSDYNGFENRSKDFLISPQTLYRIIDVIGLVPGGAIWKQFMRLAYLSGHSIRLPSTTHGRHQPSR